MGAYILLDSKVGIVGSELVRKVGFLEAKAF